MGEVGLQLSRREALRTIAGTGALLSAGLWPGALRAADAKGGESAFRFVVANDLHYFDERCGPFFERVVQQIRDTPGGRPDFILLGGDLSDWGQDFQFAAVRDIFKASGIPVHAVCGNHDWTGWDDRKWYDDLFPKSHNYTFEHKGWQVVGLDSTNRNLLSRVPVTPETFHWLDETLPNIDRQRPIIMFSHFPMHPGLQWPSTNAGDVLARFKMHNLQTVFGGHCHALREKQLGKASIVTNVCCSRKVRNHDRNQLQKGYFLCEAKDGYVKREFVEVKWA